MRTFFRSIMLSALALALVACGTTSSDNGDDNGDDNGSAGGVSLSASDAAVVNGEAIPRAQLETAMDELAESFAEIPDEDRDAAIETRQRELLTLLVQTTLIEQAITAEGIEVDEQDMATAREEMIEAVGGEEGLEDTLVQSGLTRSLFEEVFVPQQAQLDALSRQLAEGESLETRDVRHILVETQEEGDDVIARLDDGEDFAAVAEEVSTDPGSAAQGGDLGTVSPGMFVPGFEEAAWSADLNEVVGPVESDFGFHVIEVTDEAVTDAADLDYQQLSEMVAPQLNELIEGAFAAGDVQIDQSFGEWDPALNSVVPVGQVGQAPEMPMQPMPGGEGGEGISPEDLEELQRQLEEQMGDGSLNPDGS